MPLKIKRDGSLVLFILVLISRAAGADDARQHVSTADNFADWGYILRGALLIFAGALAMVGIGQKLSTRQK